LSTEPFALPSDADLAFMNLALEQADLAGMDGDVPVGCVVVDDEGVVLGRGRNRRELDKDPTAHAEVVALREAARVSGTWHLCGATLYATVEPCPMCAGAIVNARIRRVVYGCDDPKAGAARTLYALLSDPRLNHQAELVPGVLADACADRLRLFFAALRRSGKK
jgi:tRNA(adenine34) deaminase